MKGAGFIMLIHITCGTGDKEVRPEVLCSGLTGKVVDLSFQLETVT